MKLDIRYRSPIDLTQPEFQAELRRVIENSLRDFPQCADGVITLGGVEHHFAYRVHGDVVEAFVRPRNITEVAAAGIGAQAPVGRRQRWKNIRDTGPCLCSAWSWSFYLPLGSLFTCSSWPPRLRPWGHSPLCSTRSETCQSPEVTHSRAEPRAPRVDHIARTRYVPTQ